MRHCSGLVVHRQDLVALILGAQHSALAPYRYTYHFADKVPPHLLPNEAEHSAIQQYGVGEFRTRGARKFASKIFQLSHERRVLAAHLFYTPNYRYWHLFYFDNHDTGKSKNQWKHGPHIHYISDLWSTVSLEQAWAQVKSGHVAFSSKAHLRYAS